MYSTLRSSENRVRHGTPNFTSLSPFPYEHGHLGAIIIYYNYTSFSDTPTGPLKEQIIS